MSVQLEFIATDERWFETAVTGKSRVWSSGRIAEVSDAESVQLLATGKFRVFWATALADDGTPNPAAVSGAGNQRLTSSGLVSVGVLGDSIARYNYSPYDRAGLLGTVRASTAFGAWAQWACFFSGAGWPDIYSMEGYSSQTAEQVLAQAQAANATELWGPASTIAIGVRARTPKVVFDMTGTNNLFQATSATVADGTALAVAVAGRRAIWAYLRACGALPIALSLLPMQGSSVGAGGLTAAQCAPYVPVWNTALQAAADADGVPWVDGYSVCAASSGGGWKSGYIFHAGVDDNVGIHPSLLASLEIGRAAAPILEAAIASAPSLPRIYPGNSAIYSAAFVSGDPRQQFANFSNALFSSTTGWVVRYDQDSDSSLGLVTPTQDVSGGGTLRLRKPSATTARYVDWRGPTLTVAAGQEYLFFADVRMVTSDSWGGPAIGVADDTSGSASRYQYAAQFSIATKEAPLGTSVDTGVGRILLYYKVPTSVNAVCPFASVTRSAGGVAGGNDDIYISNMGQLRLA